jgi:RHS repeat-associated protein
VTLVNGTNTFTAVALDAAGRSDTNTISAYLPAAVTFLFDQNGNMRTNGTRTFEYDDENQLTRITEPNAWKSEFSYDGKMRRRVRKEWTWQNSAWVLKAEVRYVYDGNLVIQERDTFNVPNVTYIRGRDLSSSLEGAGGIGGLLARVDSRVAAVGDGRGNSYYAADGNGNVTCLIDTNQNIVARYVYDPFGNTLSETGPGAEANLCRFSSKELHPASGLVYYLFRFYEPNLQRWPNRDPIGENGGLNCYAFISNAAGNLIDPTGEIPCVYLATLVASFPPIWQGPSADCCGLGTWLVTCNYEYSLIGWLSQGNCPDLTGTENHFQCLPICMPYKIEVDPL